MSSTQVPTSSSSLMPVSERPSSSLKTSQAFIRRSKNLWLPLIPFPIHNDGEQEEIENDQQTDEPQISTSPRTGLFWDPELEKVDFSNQTMTSVFEDWEDHLGPSPAVYIEKDGSQILLITPQSSFFYPPPTPQPFGYEPFSKGFAEQDLTVAPNPQSDDDSDSNGPVLLTPKSIEHVSTPKQPKGILSVDTTYPSFGGEWSATIFYSPRAADEAASWAPKGFAFGPDVPMDCIYSAGDLSPVERWDEKLWSPILRNGLRTAPCV